MAQDKPEKPNEKPAVAEDSKVEKYLTQMKELPTRDEVETMKSTVAGGGVKPGAPAKQVTVKETVDVVSAKAENKEQPAGAAYAEPAILPKSFIDNMDLNDTAYKVYTTKDIILGAINLVTIALLVFLLVKLPVRAEEFKTARNESLKYQIGSPLELPDIADSLEMAQSVEDVFLDTSGIVEFVSRVEAIKDQGGTITKLSFTNQTAVRDKTGNYGIPVIIEMRGNMNEMTADLEKLRNLPFLFRPVSIEIAPNIDNPAILDFKYGGMIYVDETKFGKN
jgi:hypothetical protein